MSKACSVYIVAPLGSDCPVKVGLSDNPEVRLSSLQTGSPVRLRVAEVYVRDTREDAAQLERLFHEHFADQRMHGEWFNVPFEEANFFLFDNTIAPEAFGWE